MKELFLWHSFKYSLWEDFRLGPQSGIVRFGMDNDWPTSHPHEFTHTTVYPSLGQRLIRQGWEVSLPNVGLSKFVWVEHKSILTHPKANNTWLEAETKVLPLTHTRVYSSLGQRFIRQGWKVSLSDVRLSKFMRMGSKSIIAHPKPNNTWLGAEMKVLPHTSNILVCHNELKQPAMV